MSDIQKLKDSVKELRKANTERDERLNKIAENTHQRHREQAEKLTHQS